jgi:hypothetical protein
MLEQWNCPPQQDVPFLESKAIHKAKEASTSDKAEALPPREELAIVNMANAPNRAGKKLILKVILHKVNLPISIDLAHL